MNACCCSDKLPNNLGCYCWSMLMLMRGELAVLWITFASRGGVKVTLLNHMKNERQLWRNCRNSPYHKPKQSPSPPSFASLISHQHIFKFKSIRKFIKKQWNIARTKSKAISKIPPRKRFSTSNLLGVTFKRAKMGEEKIERHKNTINALASINFCAHSLGCLLLPAMKYWWRLRNVKFKFFFSW